MVTATITILQHIRFEVCRWAPWGRCLGVLVHLGIWKGMWLWFQKLLDYHRTHRPIGFMECLYWLIFIWFSCAMLGFTVRFLIRSLRGILLNLLNDAVMIALVPFCIVWDAVTITFLVVQYLVLAIVPSSLYVCFLLYFWLRSRFPSVRQVCSLVLGLGASLLSKVFVVRKPRYKSRTTFSADPEHGNSSIKPVLCSICNRTVNAARLLCGTRWFVTRPKEYFAHHTFPGLRESAQSCHLCNLLLQSLQRIPSDPPAARRDYGTITIPWRSSAEPTLKFSEHRPISSKSILRLQLVGKRVVSTPLTINETRGT
jgi:hypothetical protein